MVKRPTVSNDLSEVLSKMIKERDAEQKYISVRQVKHTVVNGCSVFFREIDNDIIIVKRLNKVLSAFEVEFLLKNSPMLKV